MNYDNVTEYILWLEKFGEIYKKYIDSSEELKEIFSGTLKKFKKVLSGNNRNLTEESVIKLLKELVKKFSAAYNANRNINKKLEGPRRTHAFKQAIYMNEIAELKEWLMQNLDNKKLFPNFESIVMYVAKKRQMIEFLKLSIIESTVSEEYNTYFDIYGKKRILNDNFTSYLFGSQARHLYNESITKKSPILQHKYVYKGQEIPLTYYIGLALGRPYWQHTKTEYHKILFEIMNELYSQFLSQVNRNNNNKSKEKDILVELYWLYMQTCPFERGSAAIGEILFSVLLRKYFGGCDFFISNGWKRNPKIIPDIHALHYELDHFKSIFWDQFTNCTGKTIPNKNNENDDEND